MISSRHTLCRLIFVIGDSANTQLTMDFSSLNPRTTNSLSLAARKNDYHTVKKLLCKFNPNCVDNRGWTCLHEAAAHDSYESLILILKHTDCRPLAESHEGHTALYLACRNKCSLKTIHALLKSEIDIANYGSLEMVTPLHIASAQGRIEIMQMLIDHGAIINVQDYDGDTPLHESIVSTAATELLLHAGADPTIKNVSNSTPFHMACLKGTCETVEQMFPFVSDINQVTSNGDSPLILAVEHGNKDIVTFLLKNGANPSIRNEQGQSALTVALCNSYVEIFKILLSIAEKDLIDPNIILYACKPHFFELEILESLLNYDLNPQYFDFIEPFFITLESFGEIRPVYMVNSPLNSFLNICEYIYCKSKDKFWHFFHLFLMRGVSVNPLIQDECPPLVYIHYCAHSECFKDVLNILLMYDCNIDYCSTKPTSNGTRIPDAFLASLTSDLSTLPLMMSYSLHCEPEKIIELAFQNGVYERTPVNHWTSLLSLIDSPGVQYNNTVQYSVSSLKHLSRLKVRSALRQSGRINTTKEFLHALEILPLPYLLQRYLRYL